MMTQPLPPRPDLRNLKNRAKSLLKAHRRRDDSVCTVLRSLSRFEESSAEEIFGAELSLTDVQYALALDYGFTSWDKLKEHIEALAGGERASRVTELVDKATRVYTAKGPSHDSIGSEWDNALRDLLGELLQAGEAGFLAAVQLSHSPNAKVRAHCTISLSLPGRQGNFRGKAHLLRLMQDRSAGVRGAALRWYAGLIHPDTWDGPVLTGRAASRFVDGVDAIAAMIVDKDAKVRMFVVRALGAYKDFGNAEVDAALATGLTDTEHKVQHATARASQVVCPGCGSVPQSFDAKDLSEPIRRQQALYARRHEALVPGDDGLKEDIEQSHSKKAKDRESAALNLGLRDDPRCDSHIARLLADEHAMVRRQAMRSYALRIHPMRKRDEPYCIGIAAHSVPDGIEHLFPLLSDSNAKNRRVAVEILADYAGLGDARIDDALKKCESNAQHKVRAAAVSALSTTSF
jgi:hypothetical protein